MPKCRECGLLAWRPGCTAGGGDDFNTYVNFDDDSDCPSFRRAKQKPLMDTMAKLLSQVRRLAQSEGWKAPPPWWREIDAALARYQKEVGDGKA